MKTIIILIAVFTITISVNSQETMQWEQNYNDIYNYNDVGNHTFVDGSGNVYVTGTSYDFDGNNSDIFTIKYGPQGGQQWVTEYGNLILGTINIPTGMTVDNSGNVYVCGEHWVSNGVTHFLTIKYNSSGNQQWAVQYAGPIDGLASANSIAVDGSGNVYVTGSCVGYFFNYDWATIKYNANGVQQWVEIYNGPASVGDDSPSRMILDNSGNVYVTGYESINSSNIEYCTIKYSPSGNQQWKSVYAGPGGYDAPNSITMDGSGNIYITGSSKGTDSYNHCATVKINSSGDQQWVQRYNGGGNGDDEGIETVFKDGNLYVCGFSQGVGTNRDYLTIKYSSSGNELWTKTYDGVSGRDQANGVAVDDYGDVYVTGESKGVDGITHITTLRYNPNGGTQWIQRYNSGQCSGYVDEGAVDVAIGPTGGVLVVGWVTHIDNNCSFPDCCTIKYTQTNLGVTPISGNIPDKYSLEQNYPNPFNPTTNINFSLPKTGNVKLVVFDITGKVVETLIDKNLSAGNYKADFDASKLASGVYLYRITTEEFTETKKMLLIK